MPESVPCKAVILAAGCGERLQPWTDEVPKSLMLVDSKPILGHQIDALLDAGVAKIVVVVGYRADDIKAFLERYDPSRVAVVENEAFATTDTMVSLWLTRDIVSDGQRLLLCNGDVVFDASIIAGLLKSATDRVVCEEGACTDESMKIAVEKDGFISDIGKAIPKERAFGRSTGVYYFSPESCDILFSQVRRIIERDERLNEPMELALQSLFHSGELKMTPFVPEDQACVDIDGREDLRLAEIRFNYALSDLAGKKAFFLDLDGTLYLEGVLLPGVLEFLAWLDAHGKHTFFLSNNSSQSTSEYVVKLNALGIPAKVDQVILSTHLAMDHLREQGFKGLFVLGTPSLVGELQDNGFDVTAERPDAVVLGFDTTLTYEKLKKACHFLAEGVPFVQTHPDLVCPTRTGSIPDAGAISALIQAATDVKPTVLGKPHGDMILNRLARIGVSPSDSVMVGDRLYTDMKMGEAAGVDTVLVLTGEATIQDLLASSCRPSHVFLGVDFMRSVLEELQ